MLSFLLFVFNAIAFVLVGTFCFVVVVAVVVVVVVVVL